jgi:hypothetical protein
MKRKILTMKTVFAFAIVLFFNVTVTAQELSVYTVNPTDDAYVREGKYADDNFSTDAFLRIKQSASSADNSRSTFLQFDLSGASVEDITNAYIKVYNYFKVESPTQVTAFGTDDNWDETTITYTNAPVNVDSIVTSGLIEKDMWVTFDISSYVVAQLAAQDSVISIHLNDLGFTAEDLRFYSKEAETNWPILMVANGVDTVAPATPENLSVTSFGLDSIAIAWDAVADIDGGLYTVYVDGEMAQVSNTTSYVATGLTADTYYDFSVIASDLFGNESESAIISVSTVSPRTSTYDLYTRSGASADDNLASDEFVRVKDGSVDFYRQGYLQFDISYQNLEAASVTKAKLKLYTKKVRTSGGIILHGIDDNTWTDDITWNTAPAISDSTIAVDTSVSDNQWAEFDVTDYIKSKMDGNTAVSFALTSNDGADIEFYGSENWEKRPTLYILGADTVAPTIPTIISAMPDTTSIDLTWNKATDSVGVENYALYLDDVMVALVDADVNTYTFSSLSSGTTYELGIAAIDLSANMSAKDSITKMTLGGLDDVSPTAPTNLYVTDITMTNATLWFTPSTDNYAVAGYVLYIDTDSIATLTDTATMYGLSKLIPNTEYDVALKAFDAAKNMSESGSITFKTSLPPDVTPPSTPTNFSAGSVIDNSVELTWDASTDDMGTITYNVYEGDNLLANVSTLSYTVSDLAENQEYVFYLEAMDNSKNKSEKASVTVTTVGIGNEAVAMVKIWCAYKNVFVNVESASNSEVKIYNVLGTIVYQNTLSEGLNTIQLNEKTGIYIVKTNINNHVNVVRVVIK